MNTQDKLAEKVRKAVRGLDEYMAWPHTDSAAGEKYKTIRAELLRLATETAELSGRLKFWKDGSDDVHDEWQCDRDRAERAEAELAKLKERIAESPVATAFRASIEGSYLPCNFEEGTRVRLVVEDGE